MSCGTGVVNVDAAIQLLNGNSKPARVLMAQVRQPFSNRNGQEPKGSKHVDDMNIAELRQEVCEGRNTIQQMQKSAEPYMRQRQNNWQGRHGMDQQVSAQPGPKTGVHVPEGAGKDYKGPQKSPAKAQARMLRTSRRTSDADEDMVYEKAAAFLVRPRDEYNKLDGATGTSMVHEEDSPFSMDKIRTSILDSEPDLGRERANLIRVKLEPKMEEDNLGLIQSDRISINVESEEL